MQFLCGSSDRSNAAPLLQFRQLQCRSTVAFQSTTMRVLCCSSDYSNALFLLQFRPLQCGSSVVVLTTSMQFLLETIPMWSLCYSSDNSNAVPLLQFSFYLVACQILQLYRCVLSLFVPHLFFLRCLGKAVLRDCGL